MLRAWLGIDWLRRKLGYVESLVHTIRRDLTDLVGRVQELEERMADVAPVLTPARAAPAGAPETPSPVSAPVQAAAGRTEPPVGLGSHVLAGTRYDGSDLDPEAVFRAAVDSVRPAPVEAFDVARLQLEHRGRPSLDDAAPCLRCRKVLIELGGPELCAACAGHADVQQRSEAP